MRLRIATLNVENLAARNSYGPAERPETAPGLSLFDFPEPETRESVEASVAVAIEDDKREITGLLIADAAPDLLALQEVDNLGVLQTFFANYVNRLAERPYGHFKLVNANDPRGIDVAFAARKDAVAGEGIRVRSHHERSYRDLGVLTPELEAMGIGPDSLVFNRDCLQVDLDLGEAELTLFICHFKAKSVRRDGSEPTAPVRLAEARAVRRIVEERFGEGWREASWIVAGDLNDAAARILPGGRSEPVEPGPLAILLDGFAVNPMAALPEAERWTYHHRDTRPERAADEHVQLDYLLLSPALAAANPEPRVEVFRRGLPYRVPLDPADPDRSVGHLATRGDRYPRVGYDRPKASDHALLLVEIDIPGRTG